MTFLGPESGVSDSRIQAFSSDALISLCVRLVILTASMVFNSQYAGLFAPFLMVSLVRTKSRLRDRWFPGRRRGSAVTAALKSLPDDYVLVSGLTLPDGKGKVDHVVIGPHGLFAVEAKDYLGDVKCEGYEWYVNRRRIPSLSRQAKHKAIALRNGLASVKSGGEGKSPGVVGVLVFSNPETTLRLHQPAVPVMRLEELVPFILNYRPMIHERAPRGVEENRAIAAQLRLLQPGRPVFTGSALRFLAFLNLS